MVTKHEQYEKKTEDLITPILEDCGFELVDVEYVKEAGNWFLRAYIDKEGGITVNDCELVSRKMSDLLDEKDFIPDSYIFEVSSPGLGRQLKKDKDFARSIGQELEVKLFRAVEVLGTAKKSKELWGKLKEFDKDAIVIVLENKEELAIMRDNIAMVRLAIDF